jgi:hypothetical protein
MRGTHSDDDSLLIKNALEQLSRSADHREECECRIRWALRGVRAFKENPVLTPAALRDQYLKAAKALHDLDAAIATDNTILVHLPFLPTDGMSSRSSREMLRDCRRDLERLASIVGAEASQKRRPNQGRTAALHHARKLLLNFGAPPARTRGEAWQTLAEVLYDDPKADLYQAMLDYTPGSDDGYLIPYDQLRLVRLLPARNLFG